ncbi:MAG: hypothetical protein WCH46_10465 [bacterium]
MKINILHGVFLSLFGVLLFGFQFIPLQDYPALLHQGFVFNEYFFHANNFGGFYQLHHYIPPNAISSIVIGVMDLIVDPFIAGRIYLFLLATSIYFGVYNYFSFHVGRKTATGSVLAFYLT